MIVFSCTGKVLKRIKKHKTIDDKEDIGFFNWYVDQINLERKNYFLFTHSLSLFSFIIYAGTKNEIINIEKLFESKAKELISRELKISETLIDQLFPKEKIYKFNKTNSKSVLGSMNDFKNQIKWQIWDNGEIKNIYYLIINRLNMCPMGAIKYKSPVEMLKEVLESKFQEKYN